jgi:hypothetical protein
MVFHADATVWGVEGHVRRAHPVGGAVVHDQRRRSATEPPGTSGIDADGRGVKAIKPGS